jgi:chromate transport protein ChrA
VRDVGCLVAILALISPRLALVVVWLFTDLLGRAYDDWIVPVLGFVLLPWTTLAYAAMWSSGRNGVDGIEWLVVALAVLLDLSSWGHGKRTRESG